MGYYTRYSGEIHIEPPLTWTEAKSGPGLQDLRLRTVEHGFQTDEGRSVTVTASAVMPLTDQPYKGYDIIEELQALVDAHGKRHEFIGHIEALGEQPYDMWRLMVKGGKAVKVKPRIVWDEGE